MISMEFKDNQTNNPKISVIIPVYNAERFLHQTLDSVLSQSLKEIEVICVDDGSTDNSFNILKEYEEKDKRVRVVTQKNEYAGMARNKGIALAKGEYIHFLDADDYVLPFTYESIYNKAVLHNLDLLKFRGIGYDELNGIYIGIRDYILGHIPNDSFMHLIDISNSDQLLWLSYTVWTGLYKTSFIRENNIEFNNLFCVNDRTFSTWVNLTAKRVMLSRDMVVVHRTNMSGSLVGKRSKYFDCLLSSIDITNNILEELNVCDDIYRQIISREIEDLLHWCKRFSIENQTNNYEQILSESEKYIIDNIQGETKDYSLDKLRGIYNKAQNNLNSDNQSKVNPYYFEKQKRENPFISVIVPVNSDDDLLEESLFSLNQQNMENSEFIIAINPKMSISYNIAQKYQYFDKRIKIVDCAENDIKKMTDLAISQALGNYYMIVKNGDFLHKDCLKVLSNKAKETESFRINCGYYEIYQDEYKTYSKMSYLPNNGNYGIVKINANNNDSVNIDNLLYYKNIAPIKKDDSIEIIPNSLTNKEKNKLIKESKKDYLLFTDDDYEYIFNNIQDYLKSKPEVVILNTKISLKNNWIKETRDMWQKNSVDFYNNSNPFKIKVNDILYFIKGDACNKIISRDFILKGNLQFSENTSGSTSFIIAVLLKANKVVLTKETLCQTFYENKVKNSVKELIDDLNTVKDTINKQDFDNLCIKKVLEAIKNKDDILYGYKYLIEDLKLDKKEDSYFYNNEFKRKIKILAFDKDNYIYRINNENEKKIYELENKIKENQEQIEDKSLNLKIAYKEKSAINRNYLDENKKLKETKQSLKEIKKELQEIKQSRTYRFAKKISKLANKVLRRK